MASSRSIGRLSSSAFTAMRSSVPSSSRTLLLTTCAMKSATSAAIGMFSASAFFWMMATRVSSSGGWMSATMPDWKRLISRSSISAICCG